LITYIADLIRTLGEPATVKIATHRGIHMEGQLEDTGSIPDSPAISLSIRAVRAVAAEYKM